MFTFFTRIPCPSRLTTTKTLTRYFVTSPGNYAGQAAIFSTLFTIKSDWTLCQTEFKKVKKGYTCFYNDPKRKYIYPF